MADNEFDGLDRLIEDSLDSLPPDDVVDHVSAGKTAFDLIIAGLALSIAATGRPLANVAESRGR